MDSARAAEWAIVPSLRRLGVGYLTGPAEGPELAGDDVVARLAEAADPRLRQALIALFLVHPELGPLVPEIAERLGALARAELEHYYIAAAYLQRLWRTRLRLLLSEQPELPPHWIVERGLPPPEERFGRAGLDALAESERRRSGSPHAYEGTYRKVAALLLEQLEIDRHAAARA